MEGDPHPVVRDVLVTAGRVKPGASCSNSTPLFAQYCGARYGRSMRMPNSVVRRIEVALAVGGLAFVVAGCSQTASASVEGYVVSLENSSRL